MHLYSDGRAVLDGTWWGKGGLWWGWGGEWGFEERRRGKGMRRGGRKWVRGVSDKGLILLGRKARGSQMGSLRLEMGVRWDGVMMERGADKMWGGWVYVQQRFWGL